MANKKKVTTAIVAVVSAVVLLLGGTFAWQSINQTALNEASDVINPGGRLHDDFNGTNKDVYVENFAEDPIFARVRLDEYFEIVMNKGSAAERTEVVTTGATKGETDTYVTHLFGDTNATDEYWKWATGGSTIYMPTFNMNKDSLEADINGTYEGPDGTDGVVEGDEADRYLNNYVYSDGEEKIYNEIYDADTNNIDEIADGTAVLDENYIEVEKAHYAKETLGATLMSMQEWIDAGSQPGAYWVYDTDGWVYWAQAIQPDTATGLLLDGIELTQVMDDSWYYAINVVAQFVTADDLGRGTNTGFYDLDKGTAPTPEALELLEKIGVDTTSVVEDDTALREALAAGGNVKIDGTIDSTTTETKDDINFNYDYLWHDGGTLSGGTLNLYTGSNRGLFINNEINWPETGDGANEATLKDITINANSVAAVYVQAIDAPVNLKNVKITSDNAGIYVNMGGETVTLDNVTIDAANNDTREGEDWFNTAVVVATPGNVVINSGSYTGDNAVYVLSSGGTVTINGGYFDGALKADAGTITITGGTFTADPTEFVDLSTYEVVTNEDGTYTVKEIGGGSSSDDTLLGASLIRLSNVVNHTENYFAAFDDHILRNGEQWQMSPPKDDDVVSNWSVSLIPTGHEYDDGELSSGTTISSDGLLTIASDEIYMESDPNTQGAQTFNVIQVTAELTTGEKVGRRFLVAQYALWVEMLFSDGETVTDSPVKVDTPYNYSYSTYCCVRNNALDLVHLTDYISIGDVSEEYIGFDNPGTPTITIYYNDYNNSDLSGDVTTEYLRLNDDGTFTLIKDIPTTYSGAYWLNFTFEDSKYDCSVYLRSTT